MGRSRRQPLVQLRRRSAAFGDSNAAQRRRAIKAADEATGLVYTQGNSAGLVSSRRLYLRAYERVLYPGICESTGRPVVERVSRAAFLLPRGKAKERGAGKYFLSSLRPFSTQTKRRRRPSRHDLLERRDASARLSGDLIERHNCLYLDDFSSLLWRRGLLWYVSLMLFGIYK